MKRSRLGFALLLVAVAAAARPVKKLFGEIGELSDEMALGYQASNALPTGGQPGFPDTSGVLPPAGWTRQAYEGKEGLGERNGATDS